jgi:hypothetical protein
MGELGGTRFSSAESLLCGSVHSVTRKKKERDVSELG